MPFRVDELFEYCKVKIAEFSLNHSNETFYSFAVDASLLCLNSDEQFRITQADFANRWGPQSVEEIKEMRANTGDWAYQGFADMSSEPGWDSELYDDHYYEAMESDDFTAKHTPYALAMSELIRQLERSDVFQRLKRTNDFYVTWVEHSY